MLDAVRRTMEWLRNLMNRMGLGRSPKLRKLIVAVIGGTVMLIGIALIVLPGPSSLVIPIGLLILATEFAWARWLLRRGKEVIDEARRGKWRKAWAKMTGSRRHDSPG